MKPEVPSKHTALVHQSTLMTFMQHLRPVLQHGKGTRERTSCHTQGTSCSKIRNRSPHAGISHRHNKQCSAMECKDQCGLRGGVVGHRQSCLRFEIALKLPVHSHRTYHHVSLHFRAAAL
eukprot:scaffold43837_cov22-Tisochrysis_lutea.AAC.1